MIKPQGNRVLVELQPYENDWLELPEIHKEVHQTAKVVEVGTGDLNGKTPDVNVGDIVMVSQTGGTMVKDGDTQYQLLDADNLVCAREE